MSQSEMRRRREGVDSPGTRAWRGLRTLLAVLLLLDSPLLCSSRQRALKRRKESCSRRV